MKVFDLFLDTLHKAADYNTRDKSTGNICLLPNQGEPTVSGSGVGEGDGEASGVVLAGSYIRSNSAIAASRIEFSRTGTCARLGMPS